MNILEFNILNPKLGAGGEIKGMTPRASYTRRPQYQTVEFSEQGFISMGKVPPLNAVEKPSYTDEPEATAEWSWQGYDSLGKVAPPAAVSRPSGNEV